MCVSCLYDCVLYVHVGTPEGQKRVSEFMKMKLQGIVSDVIEVLGIKSLSSVRASILLNTEHLSGRLEAVRFEVSNCEEMEKSQGDHLFVLSGSSRMCDNPQNCHYF